MPHPSPSAAASPVHLKFDRSGEFRKVLKSRVDEYFESNQLDQRDQPSHYLKILMVFAWFAGSYGILVFAPIPLWGRILAAISLGFAGAGMGFSVMHDAGHGALSNRPWINRLVFRSLELLGGSSYLWNVKHNVIHHTYANVEGHDDDIDMGVLGRLAPEQPRLPFHALQHFYIWFLYGLMVLKWHFIDDFRVLQRGTIGEKRVPPMKTNDKIIFVGGKLVFLTYAFIIPSIIWGLPLVFAFYLLATFFQGVTMATVFQLAHCIEEAEFPTPDGDRFEHDWATHQILTTIDFAPRNKLLSWYVGGLNYQIEHHLFPRISHMHYPALAPIVQKTCEEFDLPYQVHPSATQAVRSHFRWLRQMGRPIESPVAAV